MSNFKVGQRWYSEGEPELGLGLIETVESKRITVQFPLSSEARIYNAMQSPLKRYIIQPGEKLTTLDEQEFLIKDFQEENGVVFYLTEDEQIFPETVIHPKIDLNSAVDRILALNFDPHEFYQLRYQSYLAYRAYQEFPYKGFIGCSIKLIPHQIYVAHKALQELPVRAMLCDEVGLGKTIEAGLIMNALIKRDLSPRNLIIVPSSLVNQWFVELYKKFYLSFQIWQPETNLDETQNIIIGLDELKADIDFFEQNLPKFNWNTLIIDESHQNNYTEELSFLRSFGTTARILLSATPEVLGEENFFSQLNFLDSAKYKDFASFQVEMKNAGKISQIIANYDLSEIENYLPPEVLKKDKQEIVQTIVDRFGTGRSYYRNSRGHLKNDLFKKRRPRFIPLSPQAPLNDKRVFDAKIEKLFDFLQSNPSEKVLVMAHSKAVVLKMANQLQQLGNQKIATFHSEQSLLERDRQAAYFADPDGAQLLLCTEIGSEGRNFEFCKNLFLFDLPKVPDQLEQRIGRLDRIGQKNDINLIVPYIENSFEHTLYRYYHEVFNIFSECASGAGTFHQKHGQEIQTLLQQKYQENEVNKIIQDLKSQYQQYTDQLEKGRNFLVEKNSYHHESALNIIKEIETFEQQHPVLPYMSEICEKVGIKLEQLSAKSVFFKPLDNMYIPSFPGLPQDGVSFATTRELATSRDELHLLNWESPIVAGAFDLLLQSSIGNSAITKIEQKDIFLECIFTLQCSDEQKHTSSTYLPITPVRILINGQGQDVTKKLPKKHMDTLLSKVTEEIPPLPKEILKALTNQAKTLAQAKAKVYQSKASENVSEKLKSEQQRIETLFSTSDELKPISDKLNTKYKKIQKSIDNASLSLDAIRIVLPA